MSADERAKAAALCDELARRWGFATFSAAAVMHKPNGDKLRAMRDAARLCAIAIRFGSIEAAAEAERTWGKKAPPPRQASERDGG